MKKEAKNTGSSGFMARGCCQVPGEDGRHNHDDSFPRCAKLNSYNWLKGLQDAAGQPVFDCVEIRFKNSRKEFFRINTDYELNEGDIVAVEASPGHDIGIISLSGEAARAQMKKKGLDPAYPEMKKVYRKARPSDIEKWIESVDKEDESMFKSRNAADELDLDMKIGDVEYQGDGTKAIFYYTAEERVDFRQLIKVLADLFRVRIEMRQIGVRQESSRLGGIGTCGRELCCSTWLSNFRSVTTHSARAQQLALNPQKLAGQCGKLKCCINYEYDVYMDAQHEFPDQRIILKTKRGNGVFQKSDIFKRILWYAYENDHNIMAIPVDKVKDIIRMNENGEKPEKLEDFAQVKERKLDYDNPPEDFDLDRFSDK